MTGYRGRRDAVTYLCWTAARTAEKKGLFREGWTQTVSISVECHQEITALEQVHRTNLDHTGAEDASSKNTHLSTEKGRKSNYCVSIHRCATYSQSNDNDLHYKNIAYHYDMSTTLEVDQINL